MPDVVTFDCYGTLIDWETGIRNAFAGPLAKHGSKGDEEKVFELYEEEERRIEKEQYRPYRQVLSESVLAVAKRLGWRLTPGESGFLAEDLPGWKTFPDTNPALKRLAKSCRLGILSNIDDDLLAGTLKHLEVPFQFIVTAEKVRSYKPGQAHFLRARELMGSKARWTHVAGSTYHDIEPATKLGIQAFWVNRKDVPTPRGLGVSVNQVRNLAELADALGT